MFLGEWRDCTLFERPKFDWNPCRLDVAHAKALTVDCNANVLPNYMKHVNLDIVFKADDLDEIANSDTWVNIILRDNLKNKTESELKADILTGHRWLVDEIRNDEKKIPPFQHRSEELGLLYGSDSATQN